MFSSEVFGPAGRASVRRPTPFEEDQRDALPGEGEIERGRAADNRHGGGRVREFAELAGGEELLVLGAIRPGGGAHLLPSREGVAMLVIYAPVREPHAAVGGGGQAGQGERYGGGA